VASLLENGRETTFFRVFVVSLLIICRETTPGGNSTLRLYVIILYFCNDIYPINRYEEVSRITGGPCAAVYMYFGESVRPVID
jgi:hypothetical protein